MKKFHMENTRAKNYPGVAITEIENWDMKGVYDFENYMIDAIAGGDDFDDAVENNCEPSIYWKDMLEEVNEYNAEEYWDEAKGCGGNFFDVVGYMVSMAKRDAAYSHKEDIMRAAFLKKLYDEGYPYYNSDILDGYYFENLENVNDLFETYFEDLRDELIKTHYIGPGFIGDIEDMENKFPEECEDFTSGYAIDEEDEDWDAFRWDRYAHLVIYELYGKHEELEEEATA